MVCRCLKLMGDFAPVKRMTVVTESRKLCGLVDGLQASELGADQAACISLKPMCACM